jgi:hypothetical protein
VSLFPSKNMAAPFVIDPGVHVVSRVSRRSFKVCPDSVHQGDELATFFYAQTGQSDFCKPSHLPLQGLPDSPPIRRQVQPHDSPISFIISRRQQGFFKLLIGRASWLLSRPECPTRSRRNREVKSRSLPCGIKKPMWPDAGWLRKAVRGPMMRY